MGARDVKFGSIMDAAAWAKAGLFAVLGTPRGSPERKARLDEITLGVTQARVMADGYQGRLAPELRLATQIAEVGLRHLSGRNSTKKATGDDETAKRTHPRRRGAMIRRG